MEMAASIIQVVQSGMYRMRTVACEIRVGRYASTYWRWL